jgi:multisubunit Na+/H+ antiporter MnhG subunit
MKRRLRPDAHRSPRFPTGMRRAIYATFIATWITGVLWLLFHYFMTQQGEFGPEPHPLEAWSLRLHGLCAFVALWIGGWLWAAHARPALGFVRQRKSGITICSIFVILAVTGYLLYYASDDALRDVVRLVHWIVGLALLAPFALHALRGSRIRRRITRADHRESTDA